jgi:hypothetical protein
MTRMRGSASKDLGRRTFGTAGGWKTPGEASEKFGEVIALGEEILRQQVVPPVSRAWKPRAGRIYNFPVRTVVEEK